MVFDKEIMKEISREWFKKSFRGYKTGIRLELVAEKPFEL